MKSRLMNRSERLAAIEQLLFRSDFGLRAVEIAEACGVDRRTIYRDLTLLNDIGLPIEQKDGRFCIDRKRYSASVRLKYDEIVALLLAMQMLALRTDRLNPYVASVLSKLAQTLPETLANHVETVAEVLEQAQISPENKQILEAIIRAWGERRKVKLWCGRPGSDTLQHELSIFFIEPSFTGNINIVGFDSLSQRLHVFALQDVTRVKITRRTYRIPTRFDPQHYLTATQPAAAALFDDDSIVILAVSADVVGTLELQQSLLVHSSELMEDDRYQLVLQVADAHDLLPWIRANGAQVEVLAPQELRDQLITELSQMVALYT